MGGENEQYRLIIYSNPSDSKSHENRRFVRSHVTKRQHRSLKNQSASSTNSSCQRSRRRSSHAATRLSKQIDTTGLPIFMPPQSGPQDLSPVDSLGLLSPTSFQTNQSFDDVCANSFQLSRSGSISSASVQHEQQQHHLHLHHQQRHQHQYPFPPAHQIYKTTQSLPVSYATPPPEYQDPNHAHPIPPPALPCFVANTDAQSAYEASILLLKSTGSISQEYELTLESFACTKISAALLSLSSPASMGASCAHNGNKSNDPHSMLPSDNLMRAIAYMAHYDQIAPGRSPQGLATAGPNAGCYSLFDHHMECLVDCVKRVGGFGRLRPDLQDYVLQIDHAVAAFRSSAPYFGVAVGTPPMVSPL